MAKNYMLIYSEQLATDIELLCQNIKAPSNVDLTKIKCLKQKRRIRDVF